MRNIFEPLKEAVFAAAKASADKYIKVKDTEIVFLQGTILMLQDGFPSFLEAYEIEAIRNMINEWEADHPETAFEKAIKEQSEQKDPSGPHAMSTGH